MEKLPFTKTYKVLITVWILYSLFCLAWLAGNTAGIFFPNSWIARNNMPIPPPGGWPAAILVYFKASMVASILFPLLFCFITLIGLLKRRFFSLFTGYISLATALFTNLIFNIVTIRCGTIDKFFLFKFTLILIIEILALIYIIKYTRECYKGIKISI